MLARKIHRREPIFFLEKLINILNKKKNNNIIHWNKDGTIVIISDPLKFTKHILPKNFNHQNYSSFVRQLNLYGFHKINSVYNSTEEQFIHDNFKKDTPIDDIRNIKRKDLAYDNDEIPAKKKFSEKQIKEQIITLEGIDKSNDDKKKIEEYKKLVDNGNINIKSNSHLLEFLINKSKERIDFEYKAREQLFDLKTKIKINLKNIQTLNEDIDYDNDDSNQLLDTINSLNKDIKIKNKNYVKQTIDYFTLKNEKFEKLEKLFKNEQKIDKVNNEKNELNNSFLENVSFLIGNPRNEQPTHPSYIFLNKSEYLIEPIINNDNNNNLIKPNITNSFL